MIIQQELRINKKIIMVSPIIMIQITILITINRKMVKVLIQMIRTQRSSSQANSWLKINNLLEEKEREEYVCPKIELYSDLLFFYTNLFPLSLVN